MTLPYLQELLAPYLSSPLPPNLPDHISTYLQLLLRWNSRINLTAIRDEREIITRHFGESLALADYLNTAIPDAHTLFDLGSGAGFPGVPVALRCPGLRITLIESQGKKATFLKEVVRALHLPNAEVLSGRAETLDRQSDVVTMRAVDRSGEMLSVAHRLLVPRGTLLLMLGAAQSPDARSWSDSKLETLRGGVRVLRLTK
jgi:16S rRNA (guanine527-N7)-methyltransferase